MPAFDRLKLEVLGASHDPYIEVKIDGLPKGYPIDLTELQRHVDRRKSGRYSFSTPRRERDEAVVLSGLTDGKTDGIFVARVYNENVRPADYPFDVTPRPSHADYVAHVKYGRAVSGGGKFSGRMTVGLCIAGGIAVQILNTLGVSVASYISEIGGIDCFTYDNGTPNYDDLVACRDYEYPTPNKEKLPEIFARLSAVAADGDSVGGKIETVIFNSPVGIGGPMSDGLEGLVSYALFSIPAVKAVESGLGVGFSSETGLKCNDPFSYDDGKVVTITNFSGGINGGITNGMPVTFRTTFRPTPSVARPQQTVDLENKTDTTLSIKGRHDVAFLPRAVVVTESAVAFSYLDCAIKDGFIVDR